MITEDQTEELARLRHLGAVEGSVGDLDSIEVVCADPDQTLVRIREVLEVILTQTANSWPDVDEWARLLPGWFVGSCVDDRDLRDCVLDQWSLRAWLYWLQPAHRKWRWWDAASLGDRLRARWLVLERPYLKGSLQWLFKVAAAA